MTTAREEIFERIRRALRDVPASERRDEVQIPRGYRASAERSSEELVSRFLVRVAEYRALVRRATVDAARGEIASACSRRGLRRVVIPADLPEAWRPAGVELLADDGFATETLDTFEGVITGCALAIAETGTIALDGGPAQGRRAISLLPDYHLCVVLASQIVDTVPEGVRALHHAARAGRPITLISGPSATSDIELHRVEGVHGPRTLEVVVVG